MLKPTYMLALEGPLGVSPSGKWQVTTCQSWRLVDPGICRRQGDLSEDGQRIRQCSKHFDEERPSSFD